MRITEQQKIQIIQRIRDGEDLESIATTFHTSKSTIKRLKYTEVNTNDERVTCKICHGLFKQLTSKHLATHQTTLTQYQSEYPDSETSTSSTSAAHRLFKSKNKGKTFESIYGKAEGLVKRKKISQKQIGRASPALAGTGISGTRKDTLTYARSTYEANLDRIFQFENKEYADEFSVKNPRVFFETNGVSNSYQPDRVDIGGLFKIGAAIEVKGYMQPQDWDKICLFRKQYPEKTLFVISPDKTYADISYTELQKKYQRLIPMWETQTHNIRTNPEIYKIDYIHKDRFKFIDENYSESISNEITDDHERFIASKCLSYCFVCHGLRHLVDKVELIAISNSKPKALKSSSGEFNYEKWIVYTSNKLGDNQRSFIVSNISKTNNFCCHESTWSTTFFDNNSDMTLNPGRRYPKNHDSIDTNLWNRSEDNVRFVLQMANDKLQHKGLRGSVVNVRLIEQRPKKSKLAIRCHEKWELLVSENHKIVKYFLDNFKGPTQEYILSVAV